MGQIFLDSSFFFPFIAVDVKGCEKSGILSLLKDNRFILFRSSLTLFELSAKGGKYVLNNQISLTDLIHGLNTVQYLSQIKVIPIYYSEIQTLALKFRKIHSDFIDCILLSSAIHYTDIFLTLDGKLKEKFDNIWKKEFNLDLDFINFEIRLWKDFQKDIN